MTPKPVQVKICGLTAPDAVESCVTGNADMVGFVFYPPSPRAITVEKAASLIDRLPDRIKAVGLFVDPTDEDLDRVLSHIRLDMIQLHGSETPSRIAFVKSRYGLPVIKAVKISAPEDLVMLGPIQGVADWILFDAKPDGSDLPGGNGRVFDWRLLKNIKLTKPWMLSGGLTLDNLPQALENLKPAAVDVSSGVEDSPGVKNPGKIASFLQLVRSS